MCPSWYRQKGSYFQVKVSCDAMTEFIIQQIGHITCDNASNNNTMVDEFVTHYHRKVGEVYNVKRGHIRWAGDV